MAVEIEPAASPSRLMLQMLSGYWFSQALYVVAALQIADRLGAGPRTAEEIAVEAEVNSDALYRLLRALSSVGIFAMGPRGFELTPLSETLLSQREGSLQPVALLGGHPLHWNAWGKLLDCVKTGKPAFELAHGQPFFLALAQETTLLREFHRIPTLAASQWNELIAALALHRFRCAIDIGGGAGALASRMAEAYPDLRVILFDRPEITGLAPVRTRVEVVSGDFFDRVPENGDAYILKFVLHDWNDVDATRILSCCRRHMPDGARLLVIEVLVPQDRAPSIAKTHDVNMLVLTGGQERSLEEYRTLFRGAGFDLSSAATTTSGISVLEAVCDNANVAPITG